jgi:hypothetical protein
MIPMAIRLRFGLTCILACAAFFTACGGDDPVDPFKFKAAVRGTAYVDRDLDGRLTPLVDGLAEGVTTALVRQGTSDTVARAVAGQNGAFLMRDVEVGRYTLVAGRGAVIGDSLTVMPIDSADLVLAADDTAIREVRLTFAIITIGELAQAPDGRRVSIEGIALNTLATFGDSTIHLASPTGYTRAVRVRPGTTNVNVNDSIRVTGTVGGDQGGRKVLFDCNAIVLAPGRQPPAANAGTGRAASS